jgi:hypothetical protein
LFRAALTPRQGPVGEARGSRTTQARRLKLPLCPPLDTVHVGPTPGEGACDQGLIVVKPRGAFYQAAQDGDLLPLAMVG